MIYGKFKVEFVFLINSLILTPSTLASTSRSLSPIAVPSIGPVSLTTARIAFMVSNISGAAAIKRALAFAFFHPSVVRAMTLSMPTSKRHPVLSP